MTAPQVHLIPLGIDIGCSPQTAAGLLLTVMVTAVFGRLFFGWLADRTVMTPTLTRLVMAARARHRRLSHHLDNHPGGHMPINLTLVPQVIPHAQYLEHLDGASTSSEDTVRLFASLSLARLHPDVTSWAAAAEALNMPGPMGVRCARACSTTMLVSADEWKRRIWRAGEETEPRDYRATEDKIHHRLGMTRWFGIRLPVMMGVTFASVAPMVAMANTHPGVQGAGLKQDDIVNHFFVCSTHDWILFFTTKGRVYRAKAYELPEANRTARGQHVANLLAFQPEERIAQVIQIKSYEDAPYLVLATRNGLVKKSKLTDFDSNRSGGIVAINLRDGDELVGAVLCSAEEDLLLVSANGQSIRFSATDEALRPMGRATSGVQGMRFNADDQLLSLNVVREGTYLLVATAGGYAKRTAIEEYTTQGRGGKGILTIQYDRRRGSLVGALVVDDDSEVFAITSGGGVIRTAARQVRKAGRQTKGVRLMNLGEGDTLLAIARNAEEQDSAAEASDADTESDAT